MALVFAEQEFMNLASDSDAAAFKAFCREAKEFIRALERRPHNTCDMFAALKERYPDIMRTPLDDANERIKRLEEIITVRLGPGAVPTTSIHSGRPLYDDSKERP